MNPFAFARIVFWLGVILTFVAYFTDPTTFLHVYAGSRNFSIDLTDTGLFLMAFGAYLIAKNLAVILAKGVLVSGPPPNREDGVPQPMGITDEEMQKFFDEKRDKDG